MNVAILGASAKPERYANKAQRMLGENGHQVFPLSPREGAVLGVRSYKSILDIPKADGDVHTITVYVNPGVLESLVDEIIEAAPSRIILNPGTESEVATAAFSAAGIRVIEACTLVLLSTGQFESA